MTKSSASASVSTTASTSDRPIAVVGGGPAGLTAALELAQLGESALVFEKDSVVGGISRTASHEGFRFDIGGHRFFTKIAEVDRLWHELLGDDFIERPRLSRIYYNGKFFDYPLKPLDALRKLGPIEAVRIVLSYARVRLFPRREERSFEDWVTNRFGKRLFEIFFKSYTEKVWGIPCDEISADWAAQRIKNLDLTAAIKNALLGQSRSGEVVTTLIDRFHYPRLGPGMMWERCRERCAELGASTRMGAEVVQIRHHDGSVESVGVSRRAEGGQVELEHVDVAGVISSMPVPELIRALDPPPPADVLAAANRLRFRDFLTVVVVVDQADVFPDNWIYIHSSDVKVGRIQNFKNWSPDMVPDESLTSLGLEYFVQEGDELWTESDDELCALGARELESLGLVRGARVVSQAVVRMPKAYPVYDQEYAEALDVVREYLETLPNLQLVGRNGQHRYNNQDHSMLTGMLAARNVAGADHDLWSVSDDESYLEEGEGASRERGRKPPGDRLTPSRLDDREETSLDELLDVLSRHYDPVALGGAVGFVGAVGLFVATAILLVRGDEPLGPNLSLLGHYLFGFEVSWPGAVIGALEVGVLGFVFGWVLAWLINFQVDLVVASAVREAELEGLLESVEELRSSGG